MLGRFYGFLFIAVWAAALAVSGFAIAEERSQGSQPANPAEMRLQRSVNSREFQGRHYEGEERQIGRGDSLWRILVEEKGVPGQKFRSYLVLIRGLNPQLSNLDVLRIGDKLFVPLRMEEPGDERRAVKEDESGGFGTTISYRVKPGEHLYQILRAQLKITDERKLAQYYALVKDLNPERKNWDTLVGGEIIRLPADVAGKTQTAESEMKTSPPLDAQSLSAAQFPRKAKDKRNLPRYDPDRSLASPAKENLPLLSRVIEAMGIELSQSGEEVVTLADGTVRLARSLYPVAYDSTFKQKLVIDPNGRIPTSIKSKLGDPSVGTPVLAMANGMTMQDAVGQLLAGLGYQALPSDRPIVIQEEGVAFEAKGNWVMLAPEANNHTQEMYVISLTEKSNEIPEYLKAELERRGLHMRDVPLEPGTPIEPFLAENDRTGVTADQVKIWPRDKQELVDSLLLLYGITFGVGETLPVEIADGLRVDIRVDRLFEAGGRRTALFFSGASPEVWKSLPERQEITPVLLDLTSISTREIISRMLNLLGDPAAYREYRFSAAVGSVQDRLAVRAWGFQLTKRPVFVTDRKIPPNLQRFFFEKGLAIVYFQ